MIYFVRAKNSSEAWFKSVSLILEKGERVGNLKEILYLLVEIENPLGVNEKIHNVFAGVLRLGGKSGEEWVEWELTS